MRRSSLVFLPFVFAIPPLAAVGCDSSDPAVSSSSHWLSCRNFSDCAAAEEAVACKGGYCVDASDNRIEVSDTGVGGSSPGGTGGQETSAGGTGSGGTSSGGASSGGAEPSSGGLGQGGEDQMASPCDEPLLDAPGLSDSPRDDRNLEQLSLLAVSEIAADETNYERVVRDVAAIRDLEPEVAEIGYFSPWEAGLTINFESDADLVRIEEGDYHDWDCVNQELGAEVEVLRFDSIELAYVSVTFDKVVDVTQVAEIYQGFTGVAQASASPTLGDGPSICLLPGEDSWHYVFDDAGGDCPAGCINHVYYYFEVDEAGTIETDETWAVNSGEADIDRPDWVDVFEDAGLYSGNRFCLPTPQ